MKKIALALMATVTAVSLSGCGLSTISQLADAGKKSTDSAAETTSQASSTAPTSTSTKSSSTKTSSTKPTTSKSTTSSKPTATVKIPEHQKSVIKDGLEPIFKAHITDPNADKMTGKLKFDDSMKLTSVTEVMLNDKRITVDSAARSEASREFAKLAGEPEKDRFSELTFTFENNYLNVEAFYKNR